MNRRFDSGSQKVDSTVSVSAFLDSIVDAGETTAVVATTYRRDGSQSITSAGQVAPGGRPLQVSDRFLVASITKPIVAAATLLLASRGGLTLGDRVVDWIPEFSGGSRRSITLRHLLTHTAGLPELWDDNIALRARHAPMSEFVLAGCSAEPIARPGAGATYSSVGYAILGEVIERATQQPLRDVLAELIFQPLHMDRTSLGLTDQSAANAPDPIVEINLPEEQRGTDWHWNSAYWQTLGAPWGGLITTAGDVMTFLRAFAGWDSSNLFPTLVRDAAWKNQLPEIGLESSSAKRRGWGLGWRLNWPGHVAALCELLPQDAVGHYGATGTVMWVSGDLAAVILTSEPAIRRPRLLQRISNVIVASN